MDRLKRLDDSPDTEVVVIFRAVKSSDDQVNYAEVVMVGLFFSLGYFSCFFFLGLQPLHYFLCLLVLVDHDITDTEVGNHNGSQTQHVVSILIDDRLIVPDSFVVALKNEEDVGHVQLPSLMVCTKLSALSEQLFNHRVVLLVPVDLGLRHQHWNVLLQTLIKLLQRLLDAFVVLREPCVLNAFGKLSQRVDVPVGNQIQLSEGLFR